MGPRLDVVYEFIIWHHPGMSEFFDDFFPSAVICSGCNSPTCSASFDRIISSIVFNG